MVSAASGADAVVLLVDVKTGMTAQTRRHLGVSALLRVPRLIFAVNKMDLAGYAEDAYAARRDELLEASAALGLPDAETVPVSAKAGDNVVAASTRMTWYDGPTLMGLLEAVVSDRERRAGLPPRFVVHAVRRNAEKERFYLGRVDSGSLSLDDMVAVARTGERSRITAIHHGPKSLAEATAGSSVAIRLAEERDIGQGDLLVAPNSAPMLSDTVTAEIFWLATAPGHARCCFKPQAAALGLVSPRSGRASTSLPSKRRKMPHRNSGRTTSRRSKSRSPNRLRSTRTLPTAVPEVSC